MSGTIKAVTIIVPNLQGEAMLDWFRSLTTSRLKAMWDDERHEHHCDEIHRVMNERGEGHHVAV